MKTRSNLVVVVVYLTSSTVYQRFPRQPIELQNLVRSLIRSFYNLTIKNPLWHSQLQWLLPKVTARLKCDQILHANSYISTRSLGNQAHNWQISCYWDQAQVSHPSLSGLSCFSSILAVFMNWNRTSYKYHIIHFYKLYKSRKANIKYLEILRKKLRIKIIQ